MMEQIITDPLYQLLSESITGLIFVFFLSIWYRRSIMMMKNQAEQMDRMLQLLDKCINNCQEKS